MVELLVARDIMLEVCPTSNDLLQVVERLDDHPLPSLVDAGLRVCRNSDGPGWFATDLVTELAIASEVLGVTLDQHRAMQLDAVAASFMSAEAATTLRQAIAAH